LRPVLFRFDPFLLDGSARGWFISVLPDPAAHSTDDHLFLSFFFQPTTTVREAFIFSALLRQPASTPYEEKIAFVDSVIDLLELTDLQHAFIGTGLAGESRKESVGSF